MKASRLANLFAAIALLSGCGQSGTPIPQGSAAQPVRAHRSSGSSGDLIYATGGCLGTCVVSYPTGRLVQTLPVGGAGACADAAGNVYISNGSTALYEYAHGGSTPIKAFTVSSGTVNGCAIDTQTGDVAVTGVLSDEYNVEIFPSAGGPTKGYALASGLGFCSYDNAGNLFVDGYSRQELGLWELAKGSSQFT